MMTIKKMIKLAALAAATLAASAAPATARVDVVAANQDLASITQAIGGDLVKVSYLIRGNQDPHLIEPRPSQVLKLTRADLVVRIGMDLDLWFDSLLNAANNRKITVGAPGYVDASLGVKPIEVPAGRLDPSLGDIHVFGNPHYITGPTNLPRVAANITLGLKAVDGANAARYQAGYEALVKRLNAELPRWRRALAGHKGKAVVTYHKSMGYFLRDFGLLEFGTAEPRPGIEPTVGHISRVAGAMKSASVKTILTENYRPRRFADLLARQSSARVVVLPGGVGGEKGIDDWFDLMNAWVSRVAGSL